MVFPCPAEQLGNLRIRYEYITQVDSVFHLHGDFSPDAKWEVKVDGIETDKYQQNNNLISFPDLSLRAETLIEVEVWEPLRS